MPHSKIKPKTTAKNVATTEKVLQPTTTTITTSSTGTVNKIVSSFISYAPICATATIVDVVVVVVVVVIVVVDVVVVYLYLRIVLSLLLLAGLFNQSGVCAFEWKREREIHSWSCCLFASMSYYVIYISHFHSPSRFESRSAAPFPGLGTAKMKKVNSVKSRHICWSIWFALFGHFVKLSKSVWIYLDMENFSSRRWTTIPAHGKSNTDETGMVVHLRLLKASKT